MKMNQILRCLWIGALLPCIGAFNAAEAGGHESNGGNLIGSEFIARGYLIHDYLSYLDGNAAILDPSQLSLFEQALIGTRVEVLNYPLHDSLGDPVDARTLDDPKNPGHKLIELNQTSWQAILVNDAEVYRLIFHEYLWAMGLDDTNFRISYALQYAAVAQAAQDPYSNSADPMNLDFENGQAAGARPTSWGGGGNGYKIVSDPTEFHTGHMSARISAQANHGEFGTLTQCFSPDEFKGGSLFYRGFIETSGVSKGWAGLWLRVDGPNGQVLAFDNMQNRGITGTTDWTEYSIQLPVAQDAIRVCFGVLLVGEGTLWTDSLSLSSR